MILVLGITYELRERRERKRGLTDDAEGEQRRGISGGANGGINGEDDSETLVNHIEEEDEIRDESTPLLDEESRIRSRE